MPKHTERYVDDFCCSPTDTFWHYSHNNKNTESFYNNCSDILSDILTGDIPDGLRMKISAHPCVSIGANSAKVGLSFRVGGADGVAEVEEDGPKLSRAGPEEGESGAVNSPSEGDTRGLRL